MKKYSVILISTIVLSKTGFSQDVKDSSAVKTTPANVATTPVVLKKNEISIDLIPLIKFVSNSGGNYNGNYDLKGTLQYKRQIKSSFFFRFGITAIQERENRPYTNIRVLPSDLNNDMLLYSGTEYKPELGVNAGMEYRWGKGKFKQFAGMDIGYLHKEKVYSDYISYVPKYSNYDPNLYAQNNNPNSLPLANNNPVYKTSSYAKVANGVAVTPFYGVQYNFSKRFFLSAQIGLSSQFLFIQNKPLLNTSPYNRGRVFEFNLSDGGILNNFSFGFRF